LSLKKAFLLQHGTFDEDFCYAAYEDGELGYRLINQGLQLVFEPTARAEHYHNMDLRAACHRMVTRGRAYDMFIEKTGMFGMSQIWMAIGTGPWMIPMLIRPMYRVAEWAQNKASIGIVYILVLMYFFQVGRGKCSPIMGIS
jgi:GT2 family glycosyltransferase